MLTFNLHEIPFSMAGSFLILTSSTASGTPRLAYRTSSRRAVTGPQATFLAHEFFEIALLRDGVEIPYTWSAQPHRLDLQVEGGGEATLAFANADTLTFEGRGVGVRWVPCKSFATRYQPTASELCLVDPAARGIHHFRASEGTSLLLNATPTTAVQTIKGFSYPTTVDFLPGENAIAWGAVRFDVYESMWAGNYPALDKALAEREKDYARWQKHLPKVPERYQSTAELAWFLLWNCQAPAAGAFTRPTILMSKSWMNAVWAWDNCFNALAVAHADPELAFNQLLMFFEYQDPNGMIPDLITDLEPIYCFTKPPIQGWSIRKMADRIGVKKALPFIRDLYKPIARLTDWWYTQRDFDGDGLCQYHHGNDSGWDNATVFDQGYPTEGADLAAHLTLQCEGLSFMAEALGKKVASLRWQHRAELQLSDLLDHGVLDNHFYSPLDGQNSAEPAQSLLNYLPLVLGHRLPKRIRQSLLVDLSEGGPFLTQYGLATEATSSPKYEADGYWRGPIWAPATYLIVDGLLDAGEDKKRRDETLLARNLAERFCDLCVSQPAFWENFNALTGQGLRCPGYSWTAAVFLLLAEYLAGSAE